METDNYAQQLGGYPPETPSIIEQQPLQPQAQPTIEAPSPQLITPSESELSLPPVGRAAKTEQDLEKYISDDSSKLLAATMAQSAFDKIKIAKEQGENVTEAEELLAKARESLKVGNYDDAIEYAGKSKEEVEKVIGADKEEEEEQ
jgi:hypothetical protein